MNKLLMLIVFLSSQICNAQDKWEFLPNAGLVQKGMRFEDIYFANFQTGFAVSLNGYIYKTTDGGSTWSPSPEDTSLKIQSFRSIEFLDDDKTGIAGALGGNNYRTDDGGISWTSIKSAFSDTSVLYSKAVCGLSHFGDNFYGVGWFNSKVGHFYRSKDKGVTWETTYIDSSLASGLVDVVFLSEDTGFVCGYKGSDYMVGSSVILKTSDGGKTWKQVFNGLEDGGEVWKLQFIDGNNAVASIQHSGFDFNSMAKSNDRGNSWTVVNTGKLLANTQGIGFVTPMKGWIGGYYTGLYQTIDGGLNWEEINFGSNFNRFFVMDSSHVYAAGKSVYRYGSDFSVGIGNQTTFEKVPHKIYPIVPNPSKGKIKIEFDLGTKTVVVLQVINVESKKLWEIHREVMNPGHYTVYWDEPNAPSGNYFIRLGNNEMAITEKFTLIR
jgi:photosystem II stability/assembly factor-like uncharacterized protein